MGDMGRGPGRLVQHFTHSKWDCADYHKQSLKLVKIDDGELDWGYRGAHNSMSEGLSQADVRWLMNYLGRLRREQIHAGLVASGATAAEAACFTDSVMIRVGELNKVARAAREPQKLTRAAATRR